MKTTVIKIAMAVTTLFLYSCIENKEPQLEPEDSKNNAALDLTTIENVTPKQDQEKETIKKTTMERNNSLVGLWRNTEILSSGSGDSYMSFATDYFLEFQENGTILNWVGSSAGAGYYVASEDRNNAEKGEWRTNENILFLIDPVTKQEFKTYFYIQDQRLMLSNENSKKIFDKIQ